MGPAFRQCLEHVEILVPEPNSYYPPYDRWYPEQLQGEKTTIHKVLDVHFFRYDWDNPYIN